MLSYSHSLLHPSHINKSGNRDSALSVHALHGAGGVYEQRGGANEGGHAMVVVGYDDNRRAWVSAQRTKACT